MIRSSSHSLKFANVEKKTALKLFLNDFRFAVLHYVDFLWENSIFYGTKVFDISSNQLDCPGFLDYNLSRPASELSARALSSASTQACGIVKAATEVQRRRLWRINNLKSKNKDFKNVQNAFDKTTLIKPTLPRNFKAELSSKCTDIQNGTHFEFFLRFKGIGNKYGKFIKLPLKGTKVSKKWSSKPNVKVLKSYLISVDSVSIRYDIPVTKKESGSILGLDQGLTTLFSFSDGTTSSVDNHGHDLSSITKKLCRQMKGSKAHHRTQKQRRNYIGFCLNKVDFSKLKTLKLEDVSDIGRYRRKNRFLSHWSPGLIKDKVMQKAEEHGVHVDLVDCTYRSQRCNQCGWVQKSNRNGKNFKCKNCHHQDDADINASKNLLIDLPKISVAFRQSRQNLEGFFLNFGQEFIVPDIKKSNICL